MGGKGHPFAFDIQELGDEHEDESEEAITDLIRLRGMVPAQTSSRPAAEGAGVHSRNGIWREKFSLLQGAVSQDAEFTSENVLQAVREGADH